MLLLVGSMHPPEAMLVTMVAVTGFLSGCTTPSRDMLVRASAPKGATGRVFGFVYSGLDAGSALMPLTVGLLLDRGRPEAVFWVLAAALLLATGSALALRQNGRAAAVPQRG
jgi:MFS family permease